LGVLLAEVAEDDRGDGEDEAPGVAQPEDADDDRDDRHGLALVAATPLRRATGSRRRGLGGLSGSLAVRGRAGRGRAGRGRGRRRRTTHRVVRLAPARTAARGRRRWRRHVSFPLVVGLCWRSYLHPYLGGCAT